MTLSETISGILTIVNFFLFVVSYIKHKPKLSFIFGVLCGAFLIIFVISLNGHKCPENVNITINPVKSSDIIISGKIEQLSLSQYNDFKVVVYYRFRNRNFYIHPFKDSSTFISKDGSWKITKVKTTIVPEGVYAFLIPKRQNILATLSNPYDSNEFHFCAEVKTEFFKME